MKRNLLFAFVLVLLPALASAQSWQYVGTFPPGDTLVTDANGMHGVAVDPDGKVWLQPFGGSEVLEFADSVLVGTSVVKSLSIRVVYVYEADGTPASFSPVSVVGSEPGDTLGVYHVGVDTTSGKQVYGTRRGAGLRSDADGNILVSANDHIFKLDYTTGQKLGKVRPQEGGGVNDILTAAAADSLGNIYTSHVFPGSPIRMFDSDLGFVENVADAGSQFSRSINVSGDGLRVYETDYVNPYTIIHERADEFSPFDSVGVGFVGLRVESSAFNPATGNIWVSSGSPNDAGGVVEAGFALNTWYEFDPDGDLATPLGSFTWEPDGGEGRPRGLAFSPDGMTAYAVQFNNAAPNVQVFQMLPVAIERVGDELPTDFSLDQNYPNPFNPSTNIAFGLAKAGQASLTVYDALGRTVQVLVDEYMPAGQYTSTFEATSGIPSGTYLYVLEVDGQRVAKRMLLLK